jgi:hypothetical protein
MENDEDDVDDVEDIDDVVDDDEVDVEPSMGHKMSVMVDTFRNYDYAYGAFEGYTGQQVLSFFTDYHGMQIMTDGFMEHLVDEGVQIELEEDDK